MIESSKYNRENYPRKCFWTQERETRVKFNPGSSANRPSNNWALMVQNVQWHSYHFELTNLQKHRINLFSYNLWAKSKELALLGSFQQKLQPRCFQLWCLPVFIISPTIYDYSQLAYLACSCSVSNMRPAHFSWWDTPESKLTSWHNSIALRNKHFQIEKRFSHRHLKIHGEIRKRMKRDKRQKFLNMKEFQCVVMFRTK